MTNGGRQDDHGRGLFVSFEGVEGGGKSTQLELLRSALVARGHDVVVTREPGGTPIGEAIRRILLDPAHKGMAPIAELLLYEAARAQFVAEWIGPALARGAVVLCDRFADSTTAYQGGGRGLAPEALEHLHRLATDGLWPDLTFVLDVPATVGLARAVKRQAADRIEQESLAFHERVRAAFLALAERDARRVRVVDGARGVDEVAREIEEVVLERLAAS